MPKKSKDELSLSNPKIDKKNKINTKKITNAKSQKSNIAINNVTSKKQPTKSIANNKKASKTTASKKVKKNTTINKKVVATNVEYYDLPYRYNETVVKILAQTPTMLFIYWDISDNDRKLYIEKYGNNFFNETKPVLVVTNKTMHYSFEVEINDFANSWYLHVNDPDCDYSIELGRRPIDNNSKVENYIYITTSNDIEMPNNHILFDKLGQSVFFKNIKNNFVKEMSISSISFIRNIGKAHNVYGFYKEIYKNEINIEELSSNTIKLDLSSSNSSTFK